MIPSGYSKTVLEGTLPGGEIWQCGIWANEAPSDEAATQAQADAFGADFTTTWGGSHNNIGNFWASNTGITQLRTYSYLDDSGKATYVGVHDLSHFGSATQSMPDQIALAITLQTGYSGRRRRGRIYWPVNAGALSSGQLSEAQCGNFCDFFATLLDAWNTHLASQSMVVLSQVAGNSHPITAIRVDSKLDTQRRRAQSMAANATATQAL